MSDPCVVRFWCDDREYEGREGEPVAAALWAAGVRTFGWDGPERRPRAPYCWIGHCFECRLVVDGTPDRRACLEPLREGMRVERQHTRPMAQMENPAVTASGDAGGAPS